MTTPKPLPNDLQQPRRVLRGVREAARGEEATPREKGAFAFEAPKATSLCAPPTEELSARLAQLAGELSCRGAWQTEGVTAVVEEIARQINAVRVVALQGKSGQILGQSGSGRIDAKNELGSALQQIARHPAVAKATLPTCIASSDDESPLQAVLQAFAQKSNTPVAWATILPTPRLPFVILAWGDISPVADSPKVLGASEAMTNLFLAWEQGSRRGLLATLARWREMLQTKKVAAIAAATFLVAAILCLPFPYHVSCSATIEPPVRTFLEAPFDGSLAKTEVNPGDQVEAGQILAHLDDRQIALDLAAAAAAVEEGQKKLQAARAGQEGSAALLAELDLKQARVKLQTLRERERRLLITSPIDGIVVRGDLRRVEGSPVKQGQTLFEVAAAGQMLAELHVPEAEIAYIREEMPVTIHLTALSQSLHGIVRRIHPRAQLQDNASIFLVEVELTDAPEEVTQLRPGMHGKASITADAYPLGWNLLHRPLQALRRAWEG